MDKHKIDRVARSIVSFNEGYFYNYSNVGSRMTFGFQFIPDKDVVSCSRRMLLVDKELDAVSKKAREYGAQEERRGVSADNRMLQCFVVFKKTSDKDDTLFVKWIADNYDARHKK